MKGVVRSIQHRTGLPVISVILLVSAAVAMVSGPVSAEAPQPTMTVQDIAETGQDGLPDDALVPPDLPGGDMPLALATSQSSIIPGFYQTSEYMIGRVAIGLLLLESDGSIDPSGEDWQEEEITLVRAQIAAAAEWWAAREPDARLSFVFDERLPPTIAVPYEPISRPRSEQKLWIGAAMTALGYDGDSYFTQVRRYVNDLRATYQTDWAFAVLVIDDSNDPDHAFADGFSAYAYLGGPFMVLTLHNGGYGVEHLGGVAAHEMGHIFLAVDQYAAAGVPCTLLAGYLGIENQNSQAGSCLSNQPSIMRSIVDPFANGHVDLYARGQVGWWDGDQNGILDPLDTPVELDLPPLSTWAAAQELYIGKIRILPHPSSRRQPVTINRITGVFYRLDGGAWMPTHAQDGTFDSAEENIEWEMPSLAEGIYPLDLLVHTWPGGERLLQAVEVVVQTGEQTMPLQKVGQMHVMANTLTVTGWAAAAQGTVADVRFQIDDGAWQSATAVDGAFDAAIEAFVLNATALNEGAHTLCLQTVDSFGQFAVLRQNFQIETPHTIYLPLVVKSQ